MEKNMRTHLIALGTMAMLTACTGGTSGDSGFCDTADTASNCGGDSGESDADTDVDSDTDTDKYTGPLLIGVDLDLPNYPDDGDGYPETAINWDCYDVDGDLTYFYDFYTIGWVGSAKLTITQDTEDSWSEVHWLASWQYDDDGWWDNLYLTLVDVDLISEVEENQAAYPDDDAYAATTLFNCSDGTLPTLAWRLDVFNDAEGTDLADCAVFGDFNGDDTDLGDFSSCQTYSK
jgi:hypothetical protein